MSVEISVAANDLSELLCINTVHAVLYLVTVITMEIFIWLIRCMVDILQKYSLGIVPWPIGVNGGVDKKWQMPTPLKKTSNYE